MADSYMNLPEVGTDALIQISPRHVVYCRQTADGIEVGLTTGLTLHVVGDWSRVTQQFRESLAANVRHPFDRGGKPETEAGEQTEGEAPAIP